MNTGAGKPAVFPKRVVRVRVRFSFLAHRGTPLPIPRCCGYSRVKYIFNLLMYIFYYYISSRCLFNILRCDVEQSLKLHETSSDPIFLVFILLLYPLTTPPTNARLRAPTQPSPTAVWHPVRGMKPRPQTQSSGIGRK